MYDPIRDPTPTPPAASLTAYQLTQSQTPSGLPLPPAFHDDWRRNGNGNNAQSRPSSSEGSGWHEGFAQPMMPPSMGMGMGYEEDRRRSSGSGQPTTTTTVMRTSMPPPPQPSAPMHRTTSGESEALSLGRPASGYGRALSTASPQQGFGRTSFPPLTHAASSPSVGGSGSYFPTTYSHGSSGVQASPRTSISHLLTPSEPARTLPPTQTQPFAFTPGGSQAYERERESSVVSQTRASGSASMDRRMSIQGWTDSEVEESGMVRRITPTAGSLAAMMNPAPITGLQSAGEQQTETPMTRTPPVLHPLDGYRSPEAPGTGERRKASEMEMSAAEALSALAGTPGARGRGEVVSPTSGVDVSERRKGSEAGLGEEGRGAGEKEGEGKPMPRKRKASAVADDGQSAVNGKPKKRPVKEKPTTQTGSSKAVAPSAEKTPKPSPRTAYNPKRISEPRSILRPISRDELAYIRNPRNIRNPLKTGRPRIVVKEDEPYPSPVPVGYVAEEPQVIERGGDKRGQARRLGGRDAEDVRSGGEGKRGREEVEEREGKRPRVDAQGKGYHVADHYNKRGNQGLDNRKESTIIGLRSCNNWIKAVMIQTYIRRRPNRPWRGERNGRVLDMGCGKGGDIQKWDRAKIGEYVGCDVAAGSIDDFHARLREKPRRFPVDLFVLDCFRQSILELPRPLLNPMFDNVSMQFCIHYAFEKVQNVRQMLENVAMYLREGGVYFGTTVSKNKIMTALSEIPEDSKELVIKNDYFSMEFSEREHDGPFGHAYKFTLLDAIDECEEYVVDWDAFTSVAAEYKLKCIYRKDFDDMFAEHVENPTFFEMAHRMQVVDEQGDLYMDPGQWAAVSMYLGFAFEKMPVSWNPTRDLLDAAIVDPGMEMPQHGQD